MFLTEKQLAILNFIRDFIRDKGIAPTLEEMSGFFNVSKVTIYEHVKALEKKGALRRTANMARSIELVEQHPSAPRTEGLVIRGQVAAGAAIEAIDLDEPFTFDAVGDPRSGRYLLRVVGDSMIGDCIRSGDLVVVEPANTAVNGDIIVAMMPDGVSSVPSATLKRFFQDGHGPRLEPSNPHFGSMRPDRLEVRGRIVGLIRTPI